MVLASLATLAAVYMYVRAHAFGVSLAHGGRFGEDFKGTIWTPDRAILHGTAPYPAASSRSFAVEPAVYPPPIFLVTLPLGWFSLHLATWAWFGILFVAAVATPAALGVRDPWCYAFWLMSIPVVDAFVVGNVSILLAFGIALAWRFRDHTLAGPVAAAATVSIKPSLWPLLAWFLITRPRGGFRATALVVVATLGAWAVIGFSGLTSYPALVHTDARLFASDGVLFVAALIQASVPTNVAAALGILGGLALLGAVILRRSRDCESFSLALLASLVATPIAWTHYLALAAVPLVIVWPTISPAWAWFPLLSCTSQLAQAHSNELEMSLLLSFFATIPVILIVLSSHLRSRRAVFGIP